MADREARLEALAARDRFDFEATGVVEYRSAGKILALGDDTALQRCEELPAGLDLVRIEIGQAAVAIDGYLGHYTLTRKNPGGETETWRGDAVLDLHETPRLSREMLPPEYFHWPPGEDLGEARAADLEDLAGEFEKPKYFDYDPSICAHGVNGRVTCSRCIDACPAGAIESAGETIEVDPHLCQGGGNCATVCPSGAIRYLYPTLRDQGKRLRDMLRSYHAAGGTRPILLFHGEACAPDDYLEHYDKLLPLAVEELGSVGPDLCLAALAYGARQVVLLIDRDVAPSSAQHLGEQLGWLREVVVALGLDSACVATCAAGAELPLLDFETEIEPAGFDMPEGKRDAIYQALNHLAARPGLAAERVELAPPAPFGEVFIDAQKCTLCMACVSACPGRALQDGSNREMPEVFFIESKCLQCGACVTTCPEDAVRLAPRLLFDAEVRNRARALNRDTPFACIACGKPFAPTSVIARMQDKLKDHHMFSSQRALDRLKMCEDCRVADIVQDPEAMGGQFDPKRGFRE